MKKKDHKLSEEREKLKLLPHFWAKDTQKGKPSVQKSRESAYQKGQKNKKDGQANFALFFFFFYFQEMSSTIGVWAIFKLVIYTDLGVFLLLLTNIICRKAK